MNRITRIPSNGPLKSPFAPRTDVVVEEETTKVVEEKPVSIPKEDTVVKNPNIVEPVVKPIKKTNSVKEIKETVEKVLSPLFEVVSIKVENSITLKIKDSFYKFGFAEERTVPTSLENKEKLNLNSLERLEYERQNLIDNVNGLIDEQIRDLLGSLN